MNKLYIKLTDPTDLENLQTQLNAAMGDLEVKSFEILNVRTTPIVKGEEVTFYGEITYQDKK